MAAVCQAVYAKLTDEIADVLASAIAEPGITQVDADRLAAKAAALQRGVDAVLLEGADAFGSELASADQSIRAGAMLANAARNVAIITRTLDNQNTRGDIRYVMGLPRE